MQKLLFYIIVTPGSLRFLKFAMWSMQQRADIEVALVANGLDVKEQQFLESFAEQLNCTQIQLPTNKVMSHGAALNVLLAAHQQPWFCFCDSDILSTDDDARDIPLTTELAALSSCEAMFWDDSPVKGLLGRCNQWPDGSVNLTSFFCVYQTSVIKHLVDKYGVGFENIAIKAIHDQAIRDNLKHKGVAAVNRKLDTGKALTVAMDIEGLAFEHAEIPSLLHIGGLSSWILNGDKDLVHAEYELSDQDLYELADQHSWLYNARAIEDTENKQFYLRRQQRLAAARYCFQLISHFVDNTPKPRHDLSNVALVAKINQIEAGLQRYHAETS